MDLNNSLERNQLEERLAQLQQDVLELSGKITTPTVKPTKQEPKSSMKQLVKLQRALREMTQERDMLLQQVDLIKQEAKQYRERVREEENVYRQYRELQEQYHQLEKAFQSSETIRKEQKKLIKSLKRKTTMDSERSISMDTLGKQLQDLSQDYVAPASKSFAYSTNPFLHDVPLRQPTKAYSFHQQVKQTQPKKTSFRKLTKAKGSRLYQPTTASRQRELQTQEYNRRDPTRMRPFL